MTESGHASRVRRVMTPAAVAAGVAALALGVASPAAALDPRTGDDLTIEAGETVDDDLYVAADTLTVEGTVEGDLVVAAREVVVEGTVEGDLVVAAREVVVEGTVEGDLLVAAQRVVVAGEVADDVRAAVAELVVEDGAEVGDDTIVLGYALEAREGSTIGGDVVVLGRQGLLDGEVADRLWGAGQGIEIGGTVGGDVDVTVGGDGGPVVPPQGITVDGVPAGLTIGDAAVIEGDVRYQAPDEADIAADARITGEVVFEQVTTADDDEGVLDEVVDRLADVLRTFASLVVVGFLLVWLLPGPTVAAAGALRRSPWPSLGWGALAFPLVAAALGVLGFVTVVLAVVLGLVTLGGLAGFVVAAGVLAALGLVLVTAVAAVLLAPVVVSLLAGRLILRRPSRDDLGARVLALVVGAAVYAVLQALPVVGWLVALVVALAGVGAIVVATWTARRRPVPAPPDDVPAAAPAT